MKTYNFATLAFNFGDLDAQLQKIMQENGYKMPCFATTSQMKKYAFWQAKRGTKGHEIVIKKSNGMVLKFKVFNIEQCNYNKNLDGNDNYKYDTFGDIPIPVPTKASKEYIKELQAIAYSLDWYSMSNKKSKRRVMCDPVMAEKSEIIRLDLEQVKYNRQCYREELERKNQEYQENKALDNSDFKGYGIGVLL